MNSYNEVRQALDPAVGVPFKELARALGMSLPKEAKKRKAVGGDIAEALLDIAKNSIPDADLAALGTEVKTIPLNTLSRPREWTKIKAFNPEATLAQPDFRTSSLFGKLRAILFVPIMKTDNDKPDYWYLRPPFLWLPTEAQLESLEADYRTLRDAASNIMGLFAGRAGRHLTINTSDTNTASKPESEKRRAWWLKAKFTRQVCEQNLWPRAGIQLRKQEQEALRESGFEFNPSQLG